ncbi:acyltransferase [Cupriavidus necator]|uniref:Acyltransferase n=2 Tax=Cupriavidus necator TaxID=106590 RepID=A0A1U9URB2_CUPNE|nr:acyltransferase [Cupriavidus necator]
MYVFLFHAKNQLPLWSEDATATLTSIMNRGFMGVDVFFVISGFILAWVGVLSRKQPDSALNFAIKRFFRVAPPYWLSTILAAYLLLQSNTMEDLAKSLLFYPRNGNETPFYGYPINGVGWTLNYEMFFYALFCGALFFRRYALLAVLVAIGVCTMLVPVILGTSISFDPYRNLELSRAYFRMATNPLVMEFALGVLCAMAYAKYRGRTPRAIVSILLTAGLGLMTWRIMAHSDGHSVLKLGLPAAVLLLGAVFAEDTGMLKIPKTAVWLGEISFSIYLVHAIIVIIIRAKMPVPLGIASQYGKFACDLGILLLVSYYWHRWIEAPSADLGYYFIALFQRLRGALGECTARHRKTLNAWPK